jgi:secernin
MTASIQKRTKYPSGVVCFGLRPSKGSAEELPTMGCDMLVALSRATRDGSTLFGHNCNRPAGEDLVLLRVEGRGFAPGERVQAGTLALPQVRRTWTVLASRCPGQWGYQHGINEKGVSIGLTTIRTKRRAATDALTGPDLVRLGLERAASARQAVDVMTDLASRYGQGLPEAEIDPAFLVADGHEAFVIEMFGSHWAMQHVGEVRAVSDICHLRQDWDHLSHGLADLAITQGWWPANGSKLDFAGAVAHRSEEDRSSMRRWGRATLLLEQFNGQIDQSLLRRVLGDHFDGCADEVDPSSTTRAESAATLCRHGATASVLRTAASLITQTRGDDALPIAWYSFGPPCTSVYFPLLLVGELPFEFQRTPSRVGSRWRLEGADISVQRAVLTALQERFDEETREFTAEAASLRRRGEGDRLARLAELFMQHNLECWENVCLEFAPVTARAGRSPAEEEVHSSESQS